MAGANRTIVKRPPRPAAAPCISFGPPRSTAGGQKVVVLDAPVAAGASAARQPSAADDLNAIHDLGKKIGQLSKNQQILQTRLDHIDKRSGALDTNVVAGADWIQQDMNWMFQGLLQLIAWGSYGAAFPPDVRPPKHPNWK